MAFKLVLFGIPLSIAAAVLVAYFRGQISLAGLLSDNNGASSPMRLQLLLVSVAAAANYLTAVVTHPSATAMPDVQDWFAPATFASQSLYLIGKGHSLGAFRPLIANLLRLGRT